MGLKSVVDNIGRQGRKIKKLLDAPTEGQKKIEKPVKAQRAYAKGQAKVAAVGAVALLTQKAVNSMSKNQMEARLKKEEEKAKEATAAKDRETAAKNAAILRLGIEKAVAQAMSNTADKKYKGGAMGYNSGGMPSRKGNYDMRKGGMFMKGTK